MCPAANSSGSRTSTSVSLAEAPPVRERHVAVEVVDGDHAGQVHGILGGAELRRVAELGLREVAHRSAHLDRRGDHVDALLDALEPDRLRAEDAARPATEKSSLRWIGRAPG